MSLPAIVFVISSAPPVAQRHERFAQPKRRSARHWPAMAIAVFACVSGATLARAVESSASVGPPTVLLAQLQALAGAGARDCGSVALHGAREAVVACAQAATASAMPYRLTVELDGGDFSWQGAVRTAGGKQWVVFYGADAADGAAAPSLSRVLCREIRFPDKGDDVLECIPSVGGR